MNPEIRLGAAPEMKKKVQIVDNRIRELPEASIEELDDEPTGKLEVGLAEAGSRGEVGKSELSVAKVDKAESRAKAKVNAETIALKKIEAGMDPEDLKDMLAGELEEVEDNIESIEDDQPVVLENEVAKRESIQAQLKAIEDYQASQQRKAA